jgi:hypothetical protein
MGFMGAPPFGEIGRRADRSCDADLSRAKLIEDEAAMEAEEEEAPLKFARVGESILWTAKLKWRVGEWDL